MGVLHMAMPTAGNLSRSGGTLLALAETTPQRSGRNSPRPRYEASLIRTTEQEAAQEELGRLVRQCMAGDQQAWQQLVVSQHRRIYAICYRFTGSDRKSGV